MNKPILNYIYHLTIKNQICYVGKTKNPNQRFKQHKDLLVHNRHHNKELQALFNLHRTFDLIVVKITDKPDIEERNEIIRQGTNQNAVRIAYTIDELREKYRRYHSL